MESLNLITDGPLVSHSEELRAAVSHTHRPLRSGCHSPTGQKDSGMFKTGSHKRGTFGTVTSIDDGRGIPAWEQKLWQSDCERETVARSSTPVELSKPSKQSPTLRLAE